MNITEIRNNINFIQFSTKDGIRLRGILSRKSTASACIIFVHGMGGTMFTPVAMTMLEKLDKKIALFSMDNRGFGDINSFVEICNGKKRRKRIGTCLERFEDCIYDLDAAISAMKRLGFKRIVLCGHSTGCQKSLFYQYKTRDKRVSAIILIAPCDDYNINKKRLGKKFRRMKNKASFLISNGLDRRIIDPDSGFSAQRMDSIINLKRPEARLFDYEGRLREFSSVKTPILALFGSKEENALRPVSKYLEILDSKSSSKRFCGLIIEGANHSFDGKAAELAKSIESWINQLLF